MRASALGAIVWVGVSRLAPRPVAADTRVSPCARLSFESWCQLEIARIRKRLAEIEQELLRRELFLERGIAAAQRHADAWDEVEARSPYRLYVVSRPRRERRVSA